MKKRKIYVIGPIIGYEDDNRPAFEAAREHLEAAGYEVEIPHDTIPPGTGRDQAIRLSIQAMMDYAYVAILPGLEHSRGANIELSLAYSQWCDFRAVTPPPSS